MLISLGGPLIKRALKRIIYLRNIETLTTVGRICRLTIILEGSVANSLTANYEVTTWAVLNKTPLVERLETLKDLI